MAYLDEIFSGKPIREGGVVGDRPLKKPWPTPYEIARVENIFCAGKKGSGVDPTCKKGDSAPKIPQFVSSDKANVAKNIQVSKEMRALAESGDAVGLLKHSGTPSPKVQAYKQQLLEHVKGSLSKEKPVPVKKALVEKAPTKSTSKPPEPSGNLTAAKEHVLASTGLSHKELVDGLQGIGSASMGVRAKATAALLTSGKSIPDAALQVLHHHDPQEAASLVKSLTKGDTAGVLKEFQDTPAYDLKVLGGIVVHTTALSGEAICYMADRRIEVGTTTRSGSYRHELGHAIRSALGGAEGHTGKNPVTDAVAHEYATAMQKVKSDPTGLGTSLSHDEYETKYGVVGRRGLDNFEENFAEHYRLYHRELYRDRNEGGNGKYLAQYRKRHPGMAKIWDAHYTTALLSQEKA